MKEFDITIPNESEVLLDVTNLNLYDYNFDAFSLSSLQKAAGIMVNNNIFRQLKDVIVNNASLLGITDKQLGEKQTEYVVDLSKMAKEKIASGEWKIGIKAKTGEMYGSLIDSKTSKIRSSVTLKERVVSGLGTLPQLAAIQAQLKEISEEIELLNRSVKRVEQGQYDDRYAGFISSRQLVIEGLSVLDETVRKNLLSSAIALNNETIGKLMFSIHRDSLSFIDKNTKIKEANNLEKLLQDSLGYLNSSVQLNLVAYTALGESSAITATLRNYQSFINQTLLRETELNGRSVAWLMDNNHKGNEGNFLKVSQNVSEKIECLITPKKELEEIGGEQNERIEE